MQKRSAEDGCGSPPTTLLKSTLGKKTLPHNTLEKFDLVLDQHKWESREQRAADVWPQFFNQNQSLKDLYFYLSSFVRAVDKPTKTRQGANVLVMESLYHAVIKTLCEREKYNDEQVAYVEYIIPLLWPRCAEEQRRQKAAASMMLALLLFDRFKETFESREAIFQWFDGIQPSKFGDKIVTIKIEGQTEKVLLERKTYYMPDREKAICAKLGTCTVFAICVQLALEMLEDDHPLFCQFRNIVFGENQHTRKIFELSRSTNEDDKKQARMMREVDHYALLLFKLAVLNRIGWKTHVSVEQYMESVKTLPNLAEDKRQAILDMLEQHAGSSV